MSDAAQTKWTPGPWRISEQGSHRKWIFSPNSESVALAAARDSDLIAAAPELYEALHAIAWQWANHPRDDISGLMRELAIPALAKARGEG